MHQGKRPSWPVVLLLVCGMAVGSFGVGVLWRRHELATAGADRMRAFQRAQAEEEKRLRAAAEADTGNPAPLLRLTGFLLDAQRNYDALDAARQASGRFPDSPLVRRALAEALFRTGRRGDAIRTMEPLARTGTADRLQWVSYLVQSGRREEAARALATLPVALASSEALRAGEEALDALRPDLAARLLAAPARANPVSVDLQTSYGLALMQSGRYREAVKPLDTAAHSVGTVPTLHYYAGSALRLSGDLAHLPDAEAHLRQATDAEPRDGLFQYELGLARAQLRDWEGARTALERAACLRSELPEIQRDLARACRRTKQPVREALAQARYLRLVDDAPAAAKLLERIAATRPDDLEVGLALSSAQHAARQFVAAGATLDRLRQRMPDRAEILWSQFRLRLSLQQWKDALSSLDELEHLSPNDPLLLSERADVLERLSRYPEAERLLLRLRELDRNNPARDYEVGRFEILHSQRADRFREGEASLRHALSARPDHADSHYLLGLLMENTGRPREAVAELRRALDATPESQDALRELGRVALQSGDRVQSEEAFRLLREAQARAQAEARLELPVSQLRNVRSSRMALGRFLLRAGNLSPAINQFEVVEHFYPDERAAHGLLEKLYGHERRFQRQYEEKVLESGPDGGKPGSGGSPR